MPERICCIILQVVPATNLGELLACVFVIGLLAGLACNALLAAYFARLIQRLETRIDAAAATRIAPAPKPVVPNGGVDSQAISVVADAPGATPPTAPDADRPG